MWLPVEELYIIVGTFMKPDEKKLERLIKKSLKGQQASASDLLFHWNGLGARGNEVVIRALNRQNGWSAFIRWAETQPNLHGRLEAIADAAGVTEDAAEELRKAGVEVREDSTERTTALRIVRSAQTGQKEEWETARSLLIQNQNLLPAVVDLLEMESGRDAAGFLSNLLDSDFEPGKEQQIRKALYRMKQKGIVPDHAPTRGRAAMATELFLFGENRIPLWQPVFFFRTHSSFSPSGDLFMLQISEGTDVEIVEQRQNLTLTSDSIKQMGNRYAEHLNEQSGLALDFHFVSPLEARYFFRKTAELLKTPASRLRMEEFLKFISGGETQDPFASYSSEKREIPSDAFLQHSYFAFWMLDAADVEPFLARAKEIQGGPIILPEPQVKQMVQVAFVEELERYFQHDRRMVWALALEKAAFFLKESDPAVSRNAWDCARALADPDLTINQIPPAATLFQRTLDSVARQKEKEQEEEKRSSVIMSPQDFEKMHRRR